mgnify:CR=1 FL=1
MLPKTHIVLGLVFSILIYFIFHLNLLQVSLIFLASIFIDVDHYLFYLFRKKDMNLKKAYFWHKGMPKNHKPIAHILHTIEFLTLVMLSAYFWQGFLFILIGLLFHSIFDILELMYDERPGTREFFLIRYLITDKDKYF